MPGHRWWKAGWHTFLCAPLTWVGLGLAWLAIYVILRMLPLGHVLVQVLGPTLGAIGLIFAATLRRRSTRAREVTPEGMPVEPTTEGALSLSLSAWRQRIGPLLLVSLLLVAIIVAFVFVLALLIVLGSSLFGINDVLTHIDSRLIDWDAIAGPLLVLTLFAFIMAYLGGVAICFVTPLVALAGMRPWSAIKLSARAGFANIGAITMFYVWLGIICIPAGILFFVALRLLPAWLALGLWFCFLALILLPVLTGASAASYYDVFEPEDR